MVTNPTYKSYSAQIAKLFCKEQTNRILCEASVVERLNNYLDDTTYPVFLSKLSTGGRMYITNIESLENKGFRIVIVDLITGVRETAWWVVSWNMPYYGQLASVLLSHQFNIISSNKTFDKTNSGNIRITWNPIKPAYGIIFVPSEPPGSNIDPPSGGSGGGGYPAPGGGGQIIQTPPQANAPLAPAGGFDIGGLLENPLLIGALALGLFLMLKK